LKTVIENGGYDIVHCHTPNAAMITRLVCRKFRKKTGLRVFYTAHGFHFYKGAPKLNWIVYYPVEKFCSGFTDKLITINKEDYELAKNKFRAKEVHYVPGVGIDLFKFQSVQTDRVVKRREIGVPENAFLLISIGELIPRKNHRVIMQALKQINNSNVHYIIGGNGLLEQELKRYAMELGIADQVHFLGFRTDVAELYKVSDVFCFPSIHEGLPVALMEAMAFGLPVCCSNIRGNNDLIVEKEGGFLFNPSSIDSAVSALKSLLEEDKNKLGKFNQNYVKQFDNEIVLNMLHKIYRNME
jgi:glycosyltransferase involved in cell wall biosynthesis